jgi:hypothetical protein
VDGAGVVRDQHAHARERRGEQRDVEFLDEGGRLRGEGRANLLRL